MLPLFAATLSIISLFKKLVKHFLFFIFFNYFYVLSFFHVFFVFLLIFILPTKRNPITRIPSLILSISLYLQNCTQTFHLKPITISYPDLFGQALDRLVAVSSMPYGTSTPALSTSSSSRGLTSFEWDISS